MTEKQKQRIETIRQRWLKFEYKGQADHDVQFLLTLLLKDDPSWQYSEPKVIKSKMGKLYV